MSPPLTITKAQIDDMVGILRQGIERAMVEVEREGVWSEPAVNRGGPAPHA
jgi:hypothetical protein